VAGFTGAVFADEADADATVFTTELKGDQSFDPGFVVGGAGGYKFDFGLRLEGEIAYRRNGFDDFSGTPTGGDLGATSLMANIWYEFDTGTALHPFIGGGLGAAIIDVDDFTFGSVGLRSDSQTAFAYQVGAGLAYDLSDNVTLTAEYRFFVAQDITAEDVIEIVDTVPLGIRDKFDYQAHAVMLGIRYRL
jgi:opacity protein-like surface antigen